MRIWSSTPRSRSRTTSTWWCDMLKRIWKAFQGTRVGRSIFRVGLPASNLERAQAAISSFLLHMQPAKVNRRVLKFRTTLGLGLISLYLFLILIATGVLLMFRSEEGRVGKEC